MKYRVWLSQFISTTRASGSGPKLYGTSSSSDGNRDRVRALPRVVFCQSFVTLSGHMYMSGLCVGFCI